MEEKSLVKSGRPWQGTFLGVIDIIGVVFAFLFSILFLFLQGFISSLLSSVSTSITTNVGTANGAVVGAGLFGFLAGFSLVIGFILIGAGILGIFMARGAFKGQKWSPILAIVFAVLGLLGMLSNFSNSQITGLVIDAFIVYLGAVCVKDPYYDSH